MADNRKPYTPPAAEILPKIGRLTHMGEHGPYLDKAAFEFDLFGGMAEDIIIERLAAYEETGLTPEEIAIMQTVFRGMKGGEYIRLDDEIRELIKAKNQGRLVILPISIGSDFRRMDYPESLAMRRNVRPAIQTTGIDWPGGYEVEGFMPLHIFDEYLKSGTIVALERSDNDG